MWFAFFFSSDSVMSSCPHTLVFSLLFIPLLPLFSVLLLFSHLFCSPPPLPSSIISPILDGDITPMGSSISGAAQFPLSGRPSVGLAPVPGHLEQCLRGLYSGPVLHSGEGSACDQGDVVMGIIFIKCMKNGVVL